MKKLEYMGLVEVSLLGWHMILFFLTERERVCVGPVGREVKGKERERRDRERLKL